MAKEVNPEWAGLIEEGVRRLAIGVGVGAAASLLLWRRAAAWKFMAFGFCTGIPVGLTYQASERHWSAFARSAIGPGLLEDTKPSLKEAEAKEVPSIRGREE